MKKTETYLYELLAEVRALRTTLAQDESMKVSSRRASSRGLKPSILAAALGVHSRTIVRAIEDGRIEAVPCGKSWSIPRAEAERIKLYGLAPKAGGAQ